MIDHVVAEEISPDDPSGDPPLRFHGPLDLESELPQGGDLAQDEGMGRGRIERCQITETGQGTGRGGHGA